jgi:signal transduction histidine kinase/class 3 adenylate cyclase
MTGTELLSIAAQKFPHVVRIMLTGYTDAHNLVEAINTGQVFRYLTKPWQKQELEQIVREAIALYRLAKQQTEQLQYQLQRETLFNNLTRRIRSASSYQSALQAVVNEVGSALQAHYCVLRNVLDQALTDECYLYEAESGSAVCKAQDFSLPASDPSDPSSHTSLLATVWMVDEIELISDAASGGSGVAPNPECCQAYGQYRICSSLLVPLKAQGQILAILALHQVDPARSWTVPHLDVLPLLADHIGLLLSEVYAYEQVRALAQREALINTITTAIRSSLDPFVIFAAITQQLGQALQVDGCTLSLWTEVDQGVQCVGLYDAEHGAMTTGLDGVIPSAPRPDDQWQNWAEAAISPRSLPRSTIPIGSNPVLQQVMLTHQPVVLDDLTQHPDLLLPDLPRPARALVVVPLVVDGQILGSISLRQNDQPRSWQAAEIQLAQTVAEQAAIAVQQARLYQMTRQQAERLLELDREKTEFFQNISHELRTPLTLILGPLETAIAAHHSLPLSQAEIVLRNARRLLRLVNQLLDLQRLQAGQMRLHCSPCDLVDCVRQIVHCFGPYCQKKGIQLQLQSQPCPHLYLDLERVDKIIYNLLSNAVKFTPAHGAITVRLFPYKGGCCLQIRDTGIGIRADQLPYLFERFRQAEGSTNRTYEGTGIGLALVKQLVELHGGQVAVQSTYGQGSCFSVWLPGGTAHLSADAVTDAPKTLQLNRAAIELADIQTDGQEATDLDWQIPALSADAATAATRILVVEDHPDLRTYIAAIVRQQGYEVLIAKNGAEGLALAEAHRPQLVITDLMLPQVSGLELIQQVRQHPQLRGVPIILLTAKADEQSHVEATEYGADVYLAKPFQDRVLLAEVRNLLALKAQEQQVTQLNHYLTEAVLQRFLPPTLVERAARGELNLDLSPEPRLVTVLFSDLVGFTQLSNTLRSRRIATMLNEYLAAMTQVVFDHGGTVDKFMGDAVLALFGAPEELPPNQQVRQAIATARSMGCILEALNANWQEQGLPPLQVRCGIHQGTAVVGMFGGAQRADYTAIGPSVNIAARLQAAAAPGHILVSAAVADYLEDSDGLTKGEPLHLKGIDETVLTFDVALHPEVVSNSAA